MRRAAFVFSLLLAMPGLAAAQQASLVEAARKEGGKVVVYAPLRMTPWT